MFPSEVIPQYDRIIPRPFPPGHAAVDTASSSSDNSLTTSTGPKISSCAILERTYIGELATAFQRESFQIVGGVAHNPLSDGSGARERDLVDAGKTYQHFTRVLDRIR